MKKLRSPYYNLTAERGMLKYKSSMFHIPHIPNTCSVLFGNGGYFNTCFMHTLRINFYTVTFTEIIFFIHVVL